MDRAFQAFVLSLGKTSLGYLVHTALSDLTVVAYTILQLPGTLVPERYQSLDLLRLHQRCHHASRASRPMIYDSVQLDHVR